MYRTLATVLFAVSLAAAANDDGNPKPKAPSFVPPVLRELPSPDTAIVILPTPPPKIEEGPPPVLRHQKVYPPEFVQDSILYLQDRLKDWALGDAEELLGKSTRQRPSVDDEGNPNGAIYAFPDPLRHFREFELDFEGDTGKLRTIFVYPAKLSWKDCKKLYGNNVTAADAGAGRTFYSYQNRRLDVLADAAGNVISLGIY